MPKLVRISFLAIAFVAVAMPLLADDNGKFQVVPKIFDPFRSHLVNAGWEKGTGCPTGATLRQFNPNPPFELLPPSSYTDPACPTGDGKDKANEGLLLVKTGPTLNDASAGAEIKGVKGDTITELGYDIRKPGASIADPRGSHCGAGAPRFNIFIDDQLYFIGCASPPPTVDEPGIGWQRLRWGGTTPLLAYPASGTCESPTAPAAGGLCDLTGARVDEIEIVFDEGQDALGAPDEFGAAVLDNIDVNGVLVGRGAEGSGGGGGKGH